MIARVMGCDLVVEGGDFRTALSVFRARERIFGSFEPGTELQRVNATATATVRLSPEFARAVRTALRAAGATDGLVAPAARWHELQLEGTLLRRPPGLRLDLNGVVKSLAVDDALRASGARLVAAGDDVAVSQPAVVRLSGTGTVELGGGGVATSGRIPRRPAHDWSWSFHHSSTSRWDDVTVAAGSCLEADVAAKAAFLLSADGPDWLDERGLPGRFRAGGRTIHNRTWRTTLSDFLSAVQVPLRHAVGVSKKGRS